MEAGLQLIAEQRFAEALLFFQNLADQEPNNASAYNYQGVVHAFLGDVNQAIVALERAVALNPNYGEAWTNLGVLLAMTDRQEEAIGCYERALTIDRNLPEVHNNLGVLLREKGEIEKAKASFERALELVPDYVDALNGLGLCLSNLGKLEEAVMQFRRGLEKEPDRVETLINLGLVLREQKELEEGIKVLQTAIGIAPQRPEPHNHLGLIYRDQKRLLEAEWEFRQAILLSPEYAEAYRNLGVVLYRQGKLENNDQKIEEAIGHFERCLELDPQMPEVYNNLGIVYKDKEAFDQAEANFLKAIELRPAYALAYKNLAEVYAIKKDYANAITCYTKAIDCNPKDTQSFQLLANCLLKEGRTEDALVACIRGLELNPDTIDLYKTQASIYLQNNNPQEAIKLLERAREIDPADDNTIELLGAALIAAGKLQEGRSEWESLLTRQQSFNLEIRLAFSLPVILSSVDQIKQERNRLLTYLDNLLARGATFNDPINDIATSNFYLAYHGENDRSIMAKIAQFFLQACPKLHWTAPHCQNFSRITRERIRIGICSKFLRNHTIGRLFGTVVEYLDRSKFEVILIRLPEAKQDETAQRLAQSADRVIDLDYDFFADRQRIADLELDILFYTDIGMEPLTYFLTFSRLAPVQCLTWGHPSTTGSPMMDYFISSTYFEVENAQDHFTEKLIRFRAPNICYHRPAIPPDTDRAALGLPTEGTLYICPQSLFKIHPEFDPIVAEILRGDPAGRAVFLSGLSPTWQELLLERWQKSMPDVIDRIAFVGGMPHQKFLQFLRLGDVMLDPIHFGGGNTSLEAFAMSTPVVTYPGLYTKSRLTLGFYRRMEIADCLASSPAEYVQIALRLGKDRDYNQQIRQKINDRSAVLFNDRDVIREYEQFFTTALTLYQSRR